MYTVNFILKFNIFLKSLGKYGDRLCCIHKDVEYGYRHNTSKQSKYEKSWKTKIWSYWYIVDNGMIQMCVSKFNKRV